MMRMVASLRFSIRRSKYTVHDSDDASEGPWYYNVVTNLRLAGQCSEILILLADRALRISYIFQSRNRLKVCDLDAGLDAIERAATVRDATALAMDATQRSVNMLHVRRW